MHPQTYSPGLTAATTAVRALIAAGWQYDSTSPMADDTTIRTLIHYPSGRQIDARTDNDGSELTDLTMTGLSLEQVAGAIAGAGLGETATQDQGVSAVDTVTSNQPELDARQRLAAELHRIADDIVEHSLPVPTFSLRVGGCVESRADAQAWADFLGVEIKMGGSASNIPVAEKDIKLGDGQYLNLAFQAPSEERPTDPEKQRLLERVAELEARIAEGGADR